MIKQNANRARRIAAVISLLGIAVLIGCQPELPDSKGLTLDEATIDGRLALLPDVTSAYSYLKPRWFKTGDSACEDGLLTYFLNQTGQREVVMLELSCSTSPYNLDSRHPVSISWAIESGCYCEPNLSSIPIERFNGNPYQTCLAWTVNNSNFKIYAIFAKEDTLKFVNSLVLSK
jgi:hypothetical protein